DTIRNLERFWQGPLGREIHKTKLGMWSLIAEYLERMNKWKIDAPVIVVLMLAIAQVAVAQTSTPQPSQTSSDAIHLGPRHPPPQKQQQQQPQPQQRQLQQQPSPSQQQQPQQQQQSPPQEQQQKKPQKQARSVHRSNPVPPSVMSFETALQRCQRDPHPRLWWTQHYAVIVLVGGGYYYFDSGYWFPARGYDPNYGAYDYDGPIYTYGNLLPDQVILNVQRALTDL